MYHPDTPCGHVCIGVFGGEEGGGAPCVRSPHVLHMFIICTSKHIPLVPPHVYHPTGPPLTPGLYTLMTSRLLERAVTVP